jgi:hypothetical protein
VNNTWGFAENGGMPPPPPPPHHMHTNMYLDMGTVGAGAGGVRPPGPPGLPPSLTAMKGYGPPYPPLPPPLPLSMSMSASGPVGVRYPLPPPSHHGPGPDHGHGHGALTPDWSAWELHHHQQAQAAAAHHHGNLGPAHRAMGHHNPYFAMAPTTGGGWRVAGGRAGGTMDGGSGYLGFGDGGEFVGKNSPRPPHPPHHPNYHPPRRHHPPHHQRQHQAVVQQHQQHQQHARYKLHTVYVRDVHPDVTEHQIEQVFASCGAGVADCRLCTDLHSNSRFAFVAFDSSQAAEAAIALTGSSVGGHPVRLMRATRIFLPLCAIRPISNPEMPQNPELTLETPST